MLRKFSVQNYKNFQNKIELDLTNVHDYKFNSNCISNKLLNKMLLMGHNASGKTNIGYAIFDIVYTLTDNLTNPAQVDEGSFINGMSNSNEATFYYEFQNDTNLIAYEYKKTSPFMITFEKLTIDDQLIFEFNHRTKKHITENMSMVGADKLNMSQISGSLSVLRYIANNTPQQKDSAVFFIMDFVKRMLYYRSCQDGNMFIGFHKNQEFIEQYIVKNGLVSDFEKFLNDTGKLNIKLEGINENGVTALVQKFKNKKLLFAPIASSGTKALELNYYWSKCFDEVSFLYIDEFDAYYHFELSQEILKKTINEVKAQTIFTTHNTNLVDNEIMRPDCCLLINNGRIKPFVDLTERELREGHNIEKMLRNGEFDD